MEKAYYISIYDLNGWHSHTHMSMLATIYWWGTPNSYYGGKMINGI